MTSAYIVDERSTVAGNNYVGTGVLSAVNFATDQLPKLYSQRQSDVCQATAKTGLQITVDMLSARSIELVALLGHNFTNAATVNLKGDSVPTFLAPPVNVNLSYNYAQMFYLFSPAQNYRYWRLTINDAGNAAYPYIGELVMGGLVRFTHPCSWGFSEDTTFNNVQQFTEYMVPWRFEKSEQRALVNLSFRQRPDAEANEVVTMVRSTRGSIKPVLFFTDLEDDLNGGIYGHLIDKYSHTLEFLNWHDFSDLSITEQPRCEMIKKAGF
jgi:hypothetical protein